MRIQQSPIQQVIAYSDELRDKGDPARADEVLAEAALARPLDAPDLLATLRRTLRAARADRVTARLCRTPIEPRAAVARALLDTRTEPDATVLLNSICAGSDEDIVRALTVFYVPLTVDAEGAWWPHGERPGSVAADVLCVRVLENSAARYCDLLAQLYRSGLAGPAEHAAAHFAVAHPLRAIDLAVALHRAGLHQGAASLVDNVVLRTPPRTIARLLAGIDDSTRREIDALFSTALMQRPDPHALIAALREGGAGGVADRLLAAVAESATAYTVALLYDGLLSLGAHSDADVVVARAASRTDCAEVCDVLHRTSQHRLAYLIAEQHT